MAINWGALIVNDVDNSTLLVYYKRLMGIDILDVTQDEALDRSLELSGAAIENYLDRQIALRTATEYFPHHFDTVTLHHYPVMGGVQVFLDGTEDTGYSWYKDKGGLAHLSKSGKPYDIPFDWRNYENVEVNYDAGFDPIPLDLAYALCGMASIYFDAEGTGETPTGGSGEIRSFQLYDVGTVNYQTNTAGGTTMMLQGGMIPNAIAQSIQGYMRKSV